MSCSCKTCKRQESDEFKLYGEAIAVGAALVPMWFLVSTATTVTRIEFSGKPMLDVFLSGLLFHLAAEEFGLNTWYLTNSHAAHKLLGDRVGEESYDVVQPVVDWKRLGSGACGY